MTQPTIFQQKKSIRQIALQRRAAHGDHVTASAAITERLHTELPPQLQAMLVYVSIREEVVTHGILQRTLELSGEVIVPYCLPANELGLFRLLHHSELEIGAYAIPEPAERLRAEREIHPQRLDVVLVPGAAFDERGNRIGYGKGYFDRLLSKLRPDCLKIGLAFDCQLFEEIPAQEHDIPMDWIMTPSRTIICGSAG